MDDFFTTQHVCKTFKVSHQTVKNWCDQFAAYLSPTALPESGRKRIFTTEDLRVFALVDEYHRRGFRYEDAHLALRAGQRGDIPEPDGELAPTVPPALLVQLKDEITKREDLVKALETQRDKAEGKVDLLMMQLTQRDETIRTLYEEIGDLKAQLRAKPN